MKVLDTKFCKDYVTMADDGWQLGLHERNGGNFTYRLTDLYGAFHWLPLKNH